MVNPETLQHGRAGLGRGHATLVVALLGVGAILAVSSLLGDSLTYDETIHLAPGMSFLKTGDFRLSPENPPLARMWAALPLLMMKHHWPPPNVPGWREGDVWRVGRTWLFEYNDSGETLLIAARCMIVVLLLATWWCIYIIARRLFGSSAGVLALFLAVLSPSLLAHGRLVTTDLPVTLCILWTIIAFDGLLRDVNVPRLAHMAVALAVLSLVKFSWPLLLPALLLMSATAVLRNEPLACTLYPRAPRKAQTKKHASGLLQERGQRLLALACVAVFLGATTWIAIWACYGFRYSPFTGPDQRQARMRSVPDGRPEPTTMAECWESVLRDHDGRPRAGAVAAFVRFARDHRLLPEAYIYGLAFTHKSAQKRSSFLAGRISETGFAWYFPVAFAIKTPLALMLLSACGAAALTVRPVRRRANIYLAIGLAGFALAYGAAVLIGKLDIGHRHLLPLYPLLIVVASASAMWRRSRAGRVLITGSAVWLLTANLWNYPHYLSYFNVLIGGPSRGHLYLADSNIDWGQDLKRLARYARRHPNENIKLAYFGSANPAKYGIKCEALLSSFPFEPRAELTPGTYVISITQLLGIYEVFARDAFWDSEKNRTSFARLAQLARQPLPADATPDQRRERALLKREYQNARQGLLLNRLRRRAPDQRIGRSLFVYRLESHDLDLLLRAPAAP